MKCFVFLYPIVPYIDLEIKNRSYGKKETPKVLKQKYGKILERCIDIRYRQNGFSIYYVVFDDCLISDMITVSQEDKIIKAGVNFNQDNFVYPDPDFIIDQLVACSSVCIAGFHMWDCVEKVAKRAHERNIRTLVDEDLTEFFFWRVEDKDFKIEEYPSFDPRRKWKEDLFIEFMQPRKSRPWLWQNY